MPKVQSVATISVQILAAEEIRFDEKTVRGTEARKVDRQRRTRDGMPMVEFY